MSKASTLAMRFTEGEMSLERLEAMFDEAIKYGRYRERHAIHSRLNKAYNLTEAFDHGGMPSGEVLRDVRLAIDDKLNEI